MATAMFHLHVMQHFPSLHTRHVLSMTIFCVNLHHSWFFSPPSPSLCKFSFFLCQAKCHTPPKDYEIFKSNKKNNITLSLVLAPRQKEELFTTVSKFVLRAYWCTFILYAFSFFNFSNFSHRFPPLWAWEGERASMSLLPPRSISFCDLLRPREILIRFFPPTSFFFRSHLCKRFSSAAHFPYLLGNIQTFSPPRADDDDDRNDYLHLLTVLTSLRGSVTCENERKFRDFSHFLTHSALFG